MRALPRIAGLILLTVGASACRDTSDAPADSTSLPPSMSAAPETATASGVLSDANIVYLLDGAHVADSTRAALAVAKGTHAEVRSFGAQMVADHHALRADGLATATTLALTPIAPTGDTSDADDQTQFDLLTSESKGVSWDQAYMEYEITHLRALLETINRSTAATSSQPLKLQLMKSTPILQSHLDQAMALQSKLPH